MKWINIKNISFVTSLILMVITLIGVVLISYLESTIATILCSAIFFFLVYVVIQKMIFIIVNKKLKPIYKIIRDVPQKKKKELKEIETEQLKDMVAEVETEVTKWAQSQVAEIERLRVLEKYRKDFIGNISHELKTPIFNIQGYILTLLDGAVEDPKFNRLYLDRASKSVDRMISIVQDLEVINKLESGELKLNKESFDMFAMTDDVFEYESMTAAEKGISLKIKSDLASPLIVYADKSRIFHVLSNLVVNGIKYGKDNGVVEVHFTDMNDHVLIEVIDNGIGIRKEHLHRIFERFYRVDKGRSREQGGTGLGLAIVKHIIEAHEQTLKVNSVDNKGTTFAFTLEKALKKS